MIPALPLLAALASTICGQSGSLFIEASADGGATWTSGTLRATSAMRSLRVRVRADWFFDEGYAIQQAKFDCLVENAGEGDSAAAFLRPAPFDQFLQTVVATRFGSTIKIDDSRDTFPPGFGQRAVFSIQYPEYMSTNFNSDKPVTVFEYTLFLDGTLGDRVLDARILYSPNQSYDIVVFTSYWGNVSVLNATVRPMTVRVVCPADFNGDGQVDFFDYLDFVSAFAAEDPSADFNGDGQIDFFDCLDFVAAFAEGCE